MTKEADLAGLLRTKIHYTLIVFLHRFEISLREKTCRTCLWCILRLYDVSAVAALPPDLAVTMEEVSVSQSAQKLEITTLVLCLNLCNILECRSDCR